MKTLLCLAAAMGLSLGAPVAAQAQVTHRTVTTTQTTRNLVHNGNGSTVRRTTVRQTGPASRTVVRRTSVRTSASRSRAHIAACSRRYRSYNPRTDRFVLRAGVTRRCML